MCTALISFDPSARFPLLLAGIRDEYTDRAWDPPAEFWPGRPGVVGGRDRLAGGTWLAVDPAERRVGCVLNGTGVLALDDRRLSRGDLPLRAAGDGGLGDLDLKRMDPFHLICGEPGRVRLWSWTGEELTDQWLEPGTHLVVNTGLGGACTASGGSIPRAGLDGIR
ncbi:NRDE family protein, partial [Actinocorallia lasiicapitis]